MKFELTLDQLTKILEWQKQIDQKVLEEQKQTLPNWHELTMDGEYPYYGPIGGDLTYCFSPTSLGVVVKIKHNFTGEILDLTDYDRW